MRVVPGRPLLIALVVVAAGALLALLAGAAVTAVGGGAALAALVLAALLLGDFAASRSAWRRSQVTLTRRLPAAFAIGVRREIELALDVHGPYDWSCRLFDFFDPSVAAGGMPVAIALRARQRSAVVYDVTPQRRGEIVFEPAQLRLRSRLGFCELVERIGNRETRRVFPDFAQIARYAWLAGDRRLQEIGIKTYRRRGEGTEFKELGEYRYGNAIRRMDWKATLRLGKPIVREFQDERDQCIMVLLDCGRRMRADDRLEGGGTAHFDQVLNAVMLLAYVALRQGDAVGAMTFGTPAGDEQLFAPRKGAAALDALMGELYGVQPTPSHSDYLGAATELLRRHGKRSLVIVVTNFRDEDASELEQALRLLRSRHLVLLASLRERVVAELAAQPLVSGEAALEVASAHLYEQARRDAFRRLAARAALLVDAAPEQLGVELVNRYHEVKRAGLI
jgi:uncharacterized protein (DUF58 family)